MLLSLVVAAQSALYLSYPETDQLAAITGSSRWLTRPTADIFIPKGQYLPGLALIADKVTHLVPKDAGIAFLTQRDAGDLDYYLIGYLLPRTRPYHYVFEPQWNRTTALRALDRVGADWMLVLADDAALEAILGSNAHGPSALLHRKAGVLEVAATL